MLNKVTPTEGGIFPLRGGCDYWSPARVHSHGGAAIGHGHGFGNGSIWCKLCLRVGRLGLQLVQGAAAKAVGTSGG
eukprot:3461699-Pyramimonas_sp.AAC.1